MAKIIVTIDTGGKLTIDAQGYVGGKCADATKGYLTAVGADLSASKVQEEVKPEMHQFQQVTNNQQLEGQQW